jgi:hypothetical protein
MRRSWATSDCAQGSETGTIAAVPSPRPRANSSGQPTSPASAAAGNPWRLEELPRRDRPAGVPFKMVGLPVVHELQGEVEILALEQVDHLLKVILLLGGDAQLVPLHLGADAFRALVADDLG